jgi:hypothetical protein
MFKGRGTRAFKFLRAIIDNYARGTYNVLFYLEHDERSEECPKGVSAIKCLINEMSYSIFSTSPLFQ